MEPARRREFERLEATGLVRDAHLLELLAAGTEPDYIERNRSAWRSWASGHIAAGRKAWQANELRWGIWERRESELQLLEGFESGEDAIELGCGTAAISAWAARKGLRPVAVDFAPEQLRTAEALQIEFGVSFRLVNANAEHVPYENESFDVVISEYGASLWCPPDRWLPEAHRLLRPEGRLLFFTTSPLLLTCTPADGSAATDRLVRDYFSRYRVEFEAGGPVEFHLSHGHWIELLRASGFVIDALIEVRPEPDARPRFGLTSTEWARRWPSEEVWITHKAG